VFAINNILDWYPKLAHSHGLEQHLNATITIARHNLQALVTARQLLIIAGHLHRNRLFVIIQNVEGNLSLGIYEDVVDADSSGAHLDLAQLFGLQLPGYHALLVLVLGG
jgi:hypothetical protein